MRFHMAASKEQMRMAEELLFSGEPKTSFVKRLYFGLFDAHRVFPFPEQAADERKATDEFVARVKAFAQEKIDPTWIDQHSTIPPEVVQGLIDLGVMGMIIPKEYGGLGLSYRTYCRTIETLARRCSSTALFVSVHQSIGLKALLLFGTKEQCQRWLPEMASGKKLSAFSLTEPEAGSDAAGIRTRAVFDAAKNIYRITGQKQWTTNGSIAGILTVMAKTEVDTPEGKREKITAFLVTPDMPGFRVTVAALEKVGMRGTTTSNLAFDNMEVPAGNVLGKIGAGLRIALTVLDYGRTTFGASCTGTAKEVLERATEHARTRHQFNRPLASFSLVKRKIATMASLVYAMDAVTQMTAGMIDRGEEDIMLETAVVKVFSSEALWTIIYEGMQIYGGRSFFPDLPLERMMRDSRLNQIGEGSNEVLRAFIGVVGMRDVGKQLQELQGALQHPLSSARKITGLGRGILRRITSTPAVPVQSSELAEEAERLGQATHRFGNIILRLLARHREEIVEEQLVLDRVATIVIALYTVTAVLSKLDLELSRGAGNDLAVGRLYCEEAFAAIDRAAEGLFRNNDRHVEAVSDRLTRISDSKKA
jgi:acyl-CoA dehydrogenase family member 9